MHIHTRSKIKAFIFKNSTVYTRQEISRPHIAPRYKGRKIKGDYKGHCSRGCVGQGAGAGTAREHTTAGAGTQGRGQGRHSHPHTTHTHHSMSTQAHGQDTPHKEEQKSTQEYIEV